MTGRQLFDTLITETQLPKEGVGSEVERLLQDAAMNIENLTIEDLREIMVTYLQEVFLETSEMGESA